MTDDKLVKDASSEEQERVTMHLLVLRQPALLDSCNVLVWIRVPAQSRSHHPVREGYIRTYLQNTYESKN